jgi:lipid-A-disaccharide synthase
LTARPADIFFAAGEASGDLQASLLAAAALRVRADLQFAGCGGDRLRALGVKLVYNTSELASIGPLSVIPRIPFLYALLRYLDISIRRNPPGLFIPVDAGAFNMRLIKLLRAGHYTQPIIYYFPPGAWLDSVDQARALAQRALALTPFEHQRHFYASLGLPVAYFGHPLVSVIESRNAQPPRANPTIVVLPGSRREEAARHVRVLAHAARELGPKVSARFVAVAASDARAAQIRTLWQQAGGPELSLSREDASEVLRRGDLAWVASGTAALEAALVGVPQIVFYVVSGWQYAIAQRRLPEHVLKSIALPNIVLRRAIVPELLQDDFTPAKLVQQTLALLESETQRQAMLTGYEELRTALGPPDSLYRIAAFVVEQWEACKLSR